MPKDNKYFTTSDVVSSNRVLYTPSSFARASLLYLQEIGTLQALKPHTSSRANLQSYLFFTVISGSGFLTYEGKKYELRSGILAVSHDTDKDPGFCNFTSIRIDNLCRIACPVHLDLFAGLSGKVHCSVPLLFVLLDVITELGIHERIIAGSLAVLKVFRPKELFVDAVAEQFLPDVVIIEYCRLF